VQAIAATGASIEWRVPPDVADAWDVYGRLVTADGWHWLRRLIAAAGTPGMGSYDTRGWLPPVEPLAGQQFTALLERADEVRSRMLRWLGDTDLLVCPAMPQPAIRHGESIEPWFGDTYSDVHNVTGWPSVVVRGATSPGGLPIGVQVVAPPWREDLALAGARVVEAASGGWQPPPI
jgi:amidase